MTQVSARMGNLIARSIPAVAKLLAAQLGVKVFFDAGEVPFVNATGIHLPSRMKACGTNEDVVLLNGFLDHEAAHIRFTDLSGIANCRSAFEKTVWNILEDIRIERLMGMAFPGCKLNLAATSKIVDSNVKPDGKESPDSLLCGFLQTHFRKNVLEHEINFADQFRDAVVKFTGEPLLNQIQAIGLSASFANDSNEVLVKAQEIVDLLKQATQPPDKSDESKDDKGQDDSEQSDDQSDEKKQASGNANGSGESNSDSDGSQDQDGSGNASGKSGSSASSESGSSSGPSGSSGAGAGSNSDNDFSDADVKKLLQALSGAGKNHFADALSKALKNLNAGSSQIEDENIATYLKSTATGKYVCGDTDSAIRKVAGKFDVLLWSKTNSQPYASTCGRLRQNRLTSVITMKNTKICDRVDESDGLNTCLHVLFDVSGSMGLNYKGTDRHAATQTAAIIAGVCERYEGISCAVTAFDEALFPVKEFDEKWPRVGARMNYVRGGGGTCMGAAHAFAIGEICRRDENRKIIVIATDGAPNSMANLSASVNEAKNAGIETRIVLIGKMDLTRFKSELPGVTCVSIATTANEISGAILDALLGGTGIE